MIKTTLSEAAAWVGGELLGADASFAGVGRDSRTVKPGELFVALRGPNFDGHDFLANARDRGACAVLASRPAPELGLPVVLAPDTRLALGRLAAAWRRRFTGPLIALTGSNGKTTVKEMLSSVLRRRGPVLATRGNLNNDIGVPLTLLELGDDEDYAVIEMGANHAGEIAYLTGLARPDVAILNNAGPAHLEGFGSLDGVARAKGEIFQGLGPGGVAVVNEDDAYADFWHRQTAGKRVVGFGLNRTAEVSGELLGTGVNDFVMRTPEGDSNIRLPLPGEHNVRNALAAAAASLAVGATLDDVRRGLEDMTAVSGRMQRLAGRHGITIFNDAYNANPASLAAALATVAAIGGIQWLVLGDMAELGEGAGGLHEEAGRRARNAGFKRLYALGEWSRHAALSFGVGGQHFYDAEQLIGQLCDALAQVDEKPVILVKGSRSMRMERVVEALVSDRSPEAAITSGEHF
jgi:UDP-N-acetylmuramoyl-tripeptide--D-alanyl-D-alanine ligase